MQESLVRINAGRATSGDVLEFIIYMLERIRHQEVDIWLGSRNSDGSVKVNPSNDPFRSAEFQEQLQQITNTIIEPDIASLGSGNIAKVGIYKHLFRAESVLLSEIR